VALCGVPGWLWGVPLRWYFLKLDDFVYLARSRTLAALWSHLATPHNAHVVPLFLLETHLLARLAGSLQALPRALSWASYATLVLAMVTTGHLVAWETGRPARGLAAMAAVGLSSVLGPAVLWYAASQALAAGTLILAMLAALQAWRSRGSWWLLAAGLIAAVAAPLFWSGGYSAGLVGLAYLWSDGRRPCRLAAALPLAASVGTAALVWRVAGRTIRTASHLAEHSLREGVGLEPAVTHTSQAVCEALVLNNLGLDAATTAGQALVLGSLLAGLWAWSRRGSDPAGDRPLHRINPLEAAGATLVLANFGMVFAVRGTETTFENLRALGWYDAIPQLGAVLFVAGWWSGPLGSPPFRLIEPPRLRELLTVVVFVAALLMLQTPRVQRVIFQYDGLAASVQPADRSVRERLRTPDDLAEQARRQRQALTKLDRIERLARQGGLERTAFHQIMEHVAVPGVPENLPGFSVLDLLDLPH
jgi:hypothetical protein